jgi:hypothetical protein
MLLCAKLIFNLHPRQRKPAECALAIVVELKTKATIDAAGDKSLFNKYGCSFF